ncbi:hypothetical protein HPB50_013304 [Hyalomma asiaticum]|uniref:Uncharacterized protein n=1 Tax=Hyalomma asiaticum TaxID=266040 RepID=A0ACB7SF12_HYAAI|nr:hypothetical protein HPB50_013304 [Hyalomma asiaticum]
MSSRSSSTSSSSSSDVDDDFVQAGIAAVLDVANHFQFDPLASSSSGSEANTDSETSSASGNEDEFNEDPRVGNVECLQNTGQQRSKLTPLEIIAGVPSSAARLETWSATGSSTTTMALNCASRTGASGTNNNKVNKSEESTVASRPPEALEDTEGPVCRICYGVADEENGPLLQPCACRGSMAFVHKPCLEAYRLIRGNKCTICRRSIRAGLKEAGVFRSIFAIDNNEINTTADVSKGEENKDTFWEFSDTTAETPTAAPAASEAALPVRRYPVRNRRAPDRYTPS